MNRPRRSHDGLEAGPSPAPPVLEVVDLCTEFVRRDSVVRAVDHVSFSIGRGETLGLVGESGSGKSVTALSIVGLVAKPAGRVTADRIMFDGRDLAQLGTRDLNTVRGRSIGFIFQNPMTSLNPTLPIGFQIAEPMRTHLGVTRAEARRRAADLLGRVGIPQARSRLDDYPHQFSGGMRQRVMIAIALACEPRLLIADEPTTALDVTVQAQILDLLRTLSAEIGTAVLLITHDLGVAAGICERVNVMYAGQLVESAPIVELFARPRMPYTQGLLSCLPRIDDDVDSPFSPIKGQPPNLALRRTGCGFAPRCDHARDVCLRGEPGLTTRGPERWARCFGTDVQGWVA